MKKIICLCLVLALSPAPLCAKDAPLKTVDYVDINRYLGDWYEIARFDHRFQKGCTATKANYSFRDDGDIRVINTCHIDSPKGKLKKAEGRAWIDDKKTNSKLKVQFFMTKIKLSLFSGKYWILELDDDYRYALVGAPSRKYLWILSRSKNLDNFTYQKLVEKARTMGFDMKKLVKTVH